MVLKGELAHNKLPKNPGGGAWQQKASDIAPKLVSEVPQPMLQVRRGNLSPLGPALRALRDVAAADARADTRAPRSTGSE